MYDVIKMTNPHNFTNALYEESAFSNIASVNNEQFFSEAVFIDGKESLQKCVECIQKIKDELDKQVQIQIDSEKAVKEARKNRSKEKLELKPFDPKAFWKNTLFKDLEDELARVFGFRFVSINPYNERYISSQKTFESRMLNAYVGHIDRFPIEGLVTDKGFYDKTKSITMEIYITLGLLSALTAEEIMGVILHEFGHSIDPAIVDIKYIETNILTKYLTDRKKEINKNEKRHMEKSKRTVYKMFLSAISWIKGFSILDIFSKKGKEKRDLDKIKKALEKDKKEFTRQEYGEAYADNFARMYGFGPQLASAFKKMSKNQEKTINSRIKKEKIRQSIIVSITLDLINDVHKTDIHRVRALIREYKEDLKDPNIPEKTKKQIEEDLKEVEKVLDEYLNNFSEFQNRVNQLINEELEKKEDN